ncbi:hypothetical protein PIB30_015540 [Stylosanthes scabra]|uniref:EF-hand domain-containing protein n=1 Tax=Stylosanthes scabra TaxID=79078 RepID=A0ABU6Z5F3_9FABA|nr:hypothetical protein [Stylosanthes scabra]
MGGGEPAGSGESAGTGMGGKIPPPQGSGMGTGTGRISGFGDEEKGGIPRPRPRPAPLTPLAYPDTMAPVRYPVNSSSTFNDVGRIKLHVRVFDKGEEGFITAAELRHVMTNHGEADSDGDG